MKFTDFVFLVHFLDFQPASGIKFKKKPIFLESGGNPFTLLL